MARHHLRAAALFLALVATSVAASAATKEHVVERNQTLLGLALRYKTTVGELQRLNPGLKAGLKPGQKVVVPDVEANECEAPKEPKLIQRCKDREATREKLRKLCASGRKLNKRDEEACERLAPPEQPPEPKTERPKEPTGKPTRGGVGGAPTKPEPTAPKPDGDDDDDDNPKDETSRCHLLRRCRDQSDEDAELRMCHGSKRGTAACKPVLARERAQTALRRRCSEVRFGRAHHSECQGLRHRDEVARELVGRCRKAPKPTDQALASCAKSGTGRAAAFAKKPRREGLVHVRSPFGRYDGPLLQNGRATAAGAAAMRKLMASKQSGDGREVDAALLAHLVRISDHFGAREIEIMSGFRPRPSNRYTKQSRHNEGRAADIRLIGVPNEALWDYCRSLPASGCGYYPNSSFVHVDTRSKPFHWVDYAGPGEPPMYAHEGWTGRYRRRGSSQLHYPWEAWKRWEEELEKKKAGGAAGSATPDAGGAAPDGDGSEPNDGAKPDGDGSKPEGDGSKPDEGDGSKPDEGGATAPESGGAAPDAAAPTPSGSATP